MVVVVVGIVVEVCGVDKKAAKGSVRGLAVAIDGRAGEGYKYSLECEEELG